MSAYWLLVFVYFSPVDGLQYNEYLGENPGYASLDECLADGLAAMNELIDQGIPEENINGGCYLVAEPTE